MRHQMRQKRIGPVTEIDIFERHGLVRVERRGYIARDGFKAMRTGANSSHVGKRCDNSDHSMSTHAKVANIVEEDDTAMVQWFVCRH